MDRVETNTGSPRSLGAGTVRITRAPVMGAAARRNPRMAANLDTVVKSLRMAAVKSPAMVAVRSSRTVDPTPTGADTAVAVGRSRLTNPVHHTGKMNLLVAIMHREDMEMSLVKIMGEDEADMVETSTRLLVVMTSMAGAVAMRASVVATVTAVRRGPSTVVRRGAMEEVTHRRTTAVVASMRAEVDMMAVAGKKADTVAAARRAVMAETEDIAVRMSLVAMEVMAGRRLVSKVSPSATKSAMVVTTAAITTVRKTTEHERNTMRRLSAEGLNLVTLDSYEPCTHYADISLYLR